MDEEYIESIADWEDYFFDVIGVTLPEAGKLVAVELLFDENQAPYVNTKPIHPSQKVKLLDNGKLEVRI